MSIFLETTIELLKNKSKNITYKLIEEETGLTTYWLDSLINRPQKERDFDPGVRKIETLYNYLSGKPFSFVSSSEIKEYDTDIDEY